MDDSPPIPQLPLRSARQLGRALRRLRNLKRTTQAELADLAGLRQPTISSVESGANGTELSTVFAILRALDLELVVRRREKSAHSPRELLGDE